MAKRTAIIAVILCLLFSLMPVSVLAAGEAPAVSASMVNPLYADILPQEDAPQTEEIPAPVTAFFTAPTLQASRYNNETYYTTPQEAAELIRPALVARQESISFHYAVESKLTSASIKTLMRDILKAATAHTGVPDEGDYLLWQYASSRLGSSTGKWSGDLCHYTLTLTVYYYTTVEQEAELDDFVAAFLAQPALHNATNQQKIRLIYDWICQNVSYDYAHQTQQNEAWASGQKTLVWPLMYTAYGAAINKTAVCQGYGLLFYRLALECGIDARVIAGEANGAHAWNIARLGDSYYLLDATWDAQKTAYTYFLRGSSHFANHRSYVNETVSGHDYDGEYDYATLGVSEEDYVRPTGGDLDGSGGIDVIDLQALYVYLSAGAVTAVYEKDPVRWQEQSDYNLDGYIDILDYQALYEEIKRTG